MIMLPRLPRGRHKILRHTQLKAPTQAMRDQAKSRNNLWNMQAWSGQSGKLVSDKSVAESVVELWDGVKAL